MQDITHRNVIKLNFRQMKIKLCMSTGKNTKLRSCTAHTVRKKGYLYMSRNVMKEILFHLISKTFSCSQVLASILYRAAREGSYVNPEKVQEILGVPDQERGPISSTPTGITGSNCIQNPV